ncbi:2Fe-2S ferredoxin, partial [Staphylococcus aureus]
MTIRLRGHHLLCMLTYVGKGYSPAFVENYDAMAGRLGRGE